MSAVSLPDGIYLIGGITSEGTVSSLVYKFDPRDQTWEQISSMNCDRTNF